jgi:hypothetical protein
MLMLPFWCVVESSLFGSLVTPGDDGLMPCLLSGSK